MTPAQHVPRSLLDRMAPFLIVSVSMSLGCTAIGAKAVSGEAEGKWESFSAAAGATLTPKTLVTTLGDTTTIAFDAGRPTALLLLTASDCYSCSTIQEDAWELYRWATKHGGRLRVVIATDTVALSRSGILDLRLPVAPLVDRSAGLLAAFGGKAHPIVAIASPQGVLVMVLNRSPRYSNYRPLRSLLQEAEAAFGTGAPNSHS